jgi:hypothetical protein
MASILKGRWAAEGRVGARRPGRRLLDNNPGGRGWWLGSGQPQWRLDSLLHFFLQLSF